MILLLVAGYTHVAPKQAVRFLSGRDAGRCFAMHSTSIGLSNGLHVALDHAIGGSRLCTMLAVLGSGLPQPAFHVILLESVYRSSDGYL